MVFADCDRNKRARVATLLSKVGAYAGYDYDARGWTHEKLYAMREVFLLSRIALRIHHCPMARDVLDITTWENGARGAHMQRVFEMVDQTGRLCVSVKSEWILVDPLTRKILRPASFTAKPLMTCDRVIDCPDPQKITLPRQGLEELGERQVRWSDLDGNGHLFSGRYGDIVWDYLPADLQAVVDEAGMEACVWEREYLAEAETAWLDELEAAGMQINYPEKDAFVEATKSVYDEFVGDEAGKVSPELLEKVYEIIGRE